MASNEAQKNLWKETFLLFDRQGNERITAREIGTTEGNPKRQRIFDDLISLIRASVASVRVRTD